MSVANGAGSSVTMEEGGRGLCFWIVEDPGSREVSWPQGQRYMWSGECREPKRMNEHVIISSGGRLAVDSFHPPVCVAPASGERVKERLDASFCWRCLTSIAGCLWCFRLQAGESDLLGDQRVKIPNSSTGGQTW